MRKRFTIMLIPHKGPATRQTFFTLWHAVLGAAATLGFAALLIACLVYTGHLKSAAESRAAGLAAETAQTRVRLTEYEKDAQALRGENETLSQTVERQEQKLGELEEKAAQAVETLESLENREAEIYAILDMDMGAAGGAGELSAVPDAAADASLDYVICAAGAALTGLEDAETAARLEREAACVPNAWPLPGGKHITSSYGVRLNPITHSGYEFHAGIDISARTGWEITAAGAGTVSFSGTDPIYGSMLRIDHGNGYVTQYGHCSELLAGEGDAVEKGETVALAGSTGRSTGPHLDFRIILNGEYIDPMGILED